MALHLIKMAVGAETIDDMRRWQKERLAKHGRLFHITRHKPRLGAEIIPGDRGQDPQSHGQTAEVSTSSPDRPDCASKSSAG